MTESFRFFSVYRLRDDGFGRPQATAKTPWQHHASPEADGQFEAMRCRGFGTYGSGGGAGRYRPRNPGVQHFLSPKRRKKPLNQGILLKSYYGSLYEFKAYSLRGIGHFLSWQGLPAAALQLAGKNLGTGESVESYVVLGTEI